MSEFLVPPIDYEAVLQSDPEDLYSIDIGGGVCRCHRAKDGLISLPIPDEPEVNTVDKLLRRAARIFPINPCYGFRAKKDGQWGPYQFITYSEFFDTVQRFIAGVRALCPWLTFQAKIGIFGKNQLHWVVAQYGIYTDGMVCVPIYDTFGDEAVRYIITHAELSVVVVSRENLQALLRAVKGADNVQLIVVMGDEPMERPSSLQDSCAFITMGQLLENRNEVPAAPTITPNELCLILYTSGTTGMPKGVMLSHGNLMATCAGLLHGAGQDVRQDDVYLSYLPLAHGFENALHVAGLARGACCAFYRGDVRVLTDDAVALRPTLFSGVPRVYQRVQQVILGRFSEKPWPIRALIRRALDDQTYYYRTGQGRSSLWDMLVFNKVKQALGGRVRMFFTGAAPSSPALQEFIQVCFGCPMIEGYGLTETSAISNVPELGDRNVGHVGPPLVSCEMKLQSVPEMNYTTDDKPFPRGEVLLRGPCIMQGYFKEPEMTKEVVDSDGWFHSGDIGRLNRNGTLSIVDRKKNIFKLAQGEYIAVERLESTIIQCPLIGQLFIYGNSYRDVLVAVVVPDPIILIPRAIDAGIPDVIPFREDGWKESFAALCQLEFTKKAVMEEIVAISKENGLKGFEIPKAIYVDGHVNDLNQAFSVENDLLTATFKLRRANILKKYQAQVDQLYKELEGN